MQCTRSECLVEWKDMVSDDEENEGAYADGNYQWVHCEHDGCHTQYWKGKNGSTCEKCRRDICEGHACDTGDYDDDDDTFLCSKCKP